MPRFPGRSGLFLLAALAAASVPSSLGACNNRPVSPIPEEEDAAPEASHDAALPDAGDADADVDAD